MSKARRTMTLEEVAEWEAELRDGTAIDWGSFKQALTNLLNRYSIENDSDTPDFLLSDLLVDCLKDYGRTVRRREKWYGRERGKPSESADG